MKRGDKIKNPPVSALRRQYESIETLENADAEAIANDCIFGIMGATVLK